MAEDLKGELKITPEITMNVQLTEQHLVDMQVSMTEEALHGAEEANIRDLTALKEKQREVDKKRNEILIKASNAVTKEVSSLVTAPLKKFGATKVNVSSHWNEGVNGLTITVEVSPDARKRTVSGRLSFNRVIPVPEEAVELAKEGKVLDDACAEIRKKLERIKIDLANIDRIERKARAALAMKTLESTPAGKKLASSLQKQLLLAPPK